MPSPMSIHIHVGSSTAVQVAQPRAIVEILIIFPIYAPNGSLYCCLRLHLQIPRPKYKPLIYIACPLVIAPILLMGRHPTLHGLLFAGLFLGGPRHDQDHCVHCIEATKSPKNGWNLRRRQIRRISLVSTVRGNSTVRNGYSNTKSGG
jgi:hypothetical protein